MMRGTPARRRVGWKGVQERKVSDQKVLLRTEKLAAEQGDEPRVRHDGIDSYYLPSVVKRPRRHLEKRLRQIHGV